MKSTPLLRVTVVTLCLVGAALYLARASRAEVVPAHATLAELPMTIDDSIGRRGVDLTPSVLAVLGVDDYLVRSYTKAGALPVGLYIGYHTSQRQGDAIHSPLNCLPGAGWTPLEQGHMVVQVPASLQNPTPVPIEINRVVIGKGLDRQLVLYWYQSHRRVVASEYWGKIYTVLDSVRYNRTDAALVRVIVPVVSTVPQEVSEERATEFVKALFPLIGPYFPA